MEDLQFAEERTLEMPIRVGFIWRLAVVALIVTANAVSCSFFPPEYRVSRSFSVHVENDIGPVVGLKLKVSRFKWQDFQKLSTEQQRYADPNSFEEIIAESITDSTGMAQFTLDRTGSFTLSPESQASQLDWVELKVLEQTTSATVEMKWPAVPILRVAHLRGKLETGLLSSRSLPLRNNAVMLHTLVDYKDVAAIMTDDEGAFEFGNAAPGLYFLQILSTSAKTDDFYKPEGNIAVYVAPESSRGALMISTVNTSCGLSYDLQENKDRYKPVACFKGEKPAKCEY